MAKRLWAPPQKRQKKQKKIKAVGSKLWWEFLNYRSLKNYISVQKQKQAMFFVEINEKYQVLPLDSTQNCQWKSRWVHYHRINISATVVSSDPKEIKKETAHFWTHHYQGIVIVLFKLWLAFLSPLWWNKEWLHCVTN